MTPRRQLRQRPQHAAHLGVGEGPLPVRRVAAPHLDEFEEIDVVGVALDELRRDLVAPAPRYLQDISSALGTSLALARLGR